jgi:hypothetical protein
VDQQDHGPSRGNEPGFLDFEALRRRAAQRRAARAASGGPRRNPFLDCDE